MSQNNLGAEFSHLPDCDHLSQLNLHNNTTNNTHIVPNTAGKQASFKIFYAISRNPKQLITSVEAQQGLILFGDYVAEEKVHANSHPNIRLLLNVIENDEIWTVTLS